MSMPPKPPVEGARREATVSGERDTVLLSCQHFCKKPACACAGPPDLGSLNERQDISGIPHESRLSKKFFLVTGTRNLAGAVLVGGSPSHFRERTNRLNCTLGTTPIGPPGCPARCYHARADSGRAGYVPLDLIETCSSWDTGVRGKKRNRAKVSGQEVA